MNSGMNFLTKNWLPIILGIAIIAAVVLNMRNNTSSVTESEDISINQVVIDGSPQCYLYEQEFELPDNSDVEFGVNREYIEITIADTGLVTGQHIISPFESNINRANFVGVSIDGFINVVATANAEGEIWQEQRMYKIENDRLYVGYQEVFVPRYENENGIYLYEDINKIIFDTDEFYLDTIDCGSVDRSVL